MAKVLPLAARELGGSGSPIVILHGLLGSSRNWQSAGVALAASGHRVIGLDLRNHGISPWDDDCSYTAMAEDVYTFLQSEKLDSVHLVGHSMGGKVAMRLAFSYPKLVSRLTIVDIAPRSYSDRVRVEFTAMNSIDLTKIKSRRDAENQLMDTVTDWGMRQFILTNLNSDEKGVWKWTVNREALTQSLQSILDFSINDNETFNGPTRFIRGGKSNYITDADTILIKKHFPAADWVTLPESGHNPHFDSRTGFVDAVLKTD
ncbi:MAG: alpha/beta hydrolase [Opitutia bacterium]|nr:alpha/beta fold hydrolase [Opitutales bacterium]PHX68867.1 MAG: alpha/beta hydrolase [Opitutae bacterium]